MNQAQGQSEPDVYVGIDIGYRMDVPEAKATVDKVSNYTNFIVFGSMALTMNLTKLNETLRYAYDKGMYFMSFPPSLGIDPGLRNLTAQWLNYTKANWENHLVGFLYPYEDEVGGHQLDLSGAYLAVPNMSKTNYTDAAAQFINSTWMKDVRRAKTFFGYPLFTSDYALYWFDYRGGYDGLFAEFAWNHRRLNLNVALCRGAATVQDKLWGVIITLSMETPPYIESAADLYDDMIYAYDNGAKYIVIMNSNADWTAGCLTQEHYNAIKQFWEYVSRNPRKSYPASERVAYMLPEALAYGFRGPENKTAGEFKGDLSSRFQDKIWGLWDTNMETFLISTSVSIMLDKFEDRLDIIYNESVPYDTPEYKEIIPWNDPQAVAQAWSSYAPWFSMSPSPSATANTSLDQKFDFSEEYLFASVICITLTFVAIGTAFSYRRRRR